MLMVEKKKTRECKFSFWEYICEPSILESCCRLVARLLQKDTATLELSYCNHMDQTRILKELLHAVGGKDLHSLRQININTNSSGIAEDFCENENYVLYSPEVFFRTLPRLPSLQVINMGATSCMDDSDLEKFAKLPNLV